MIKKILSTFLVSSVLFLAAATSSIAIDRPSIAIGGSVSYGAYTATGKETEGNSSVSLIEVSDEETRLMEVGYSSVFLEVGLGDRITIGVDYMADGVETDMTSRTDTAAVGAVASEADTGTSSIKAEFSQMVQGYLEVRLINGLYIKYAAMEIDMETKESLHTDSQYPNDTLSGNGYGFGFKNTWDNGVFIKTETMMHDWDPIKLTATGCTGTCNNTKVEGSLDGIVASFKLGKQF